MEKRKWTNIKAVEELIAEIREAGKTRQEIAEALGLGKVQIKNWINRHNKIQVFWYTSFLDSLSPKLLSTYAVANAAHSLYPWVSK